MDALLILLIILFLVFLGAGFALHLLWIGLVVVLIVAAVRFLVSRA